VTDWSAFAGVTGVVLTALLALARLSQGAVGSDAEPPPPDDVSEPWERAVAESSGPRLGTVALLANVALSQGALGLLLVFGAWWAGVPAAALGLGPAAFGAVPLLAGVGAGVGLYLANEGGAALGRRAGLGGAEALREALAPETRRGWAVLLLVVLPVVAAFEELLFRGALVGALAVGFDVSPWLLAGLSSVAFALGHGAQGRVGMAVTGVLGFALAAVFVLTGSLAAVVVAHYLVNALELVVNEA
jgi:membrane protease YdiL (CAAX protease family)